MDERTAMWLNPTETPIEDYEYALAGDGTLRRWPGGRFAVQAAMLVGAFSLGIAAGLYLAALRDD